MKEPLNPLKILVFVFFIINSKENICPENQINLSPTGTCTDIVDFLEKDDLEIDTIDLLFLAHNNEGKINKNNYTLEIFKLSDERLQSFNKRKSKIYLPKKCLEILEGNELIKLDKLKGLIVLVHNFNNINRNNIPDTFFIIRHNGENSGVKYINSKYFDLSLCHEDPIMLDEDINIQDLKYGLDSDKPIDIDRIMYAKKLKIDLFDPHSEFLKDICFKFTSENKTDVTLDSRLEDYYQNITLCNESLNSHYIGFNYSNENKILSYRCSYGFYQSTEERESYIDNIDKQMKFLFSTSNIKVITCYEQLLNLKNIIYNYGGIICILVIFIQIILYIIFCCKGTKPLEEKIKKLFESVEERPIKFESSQDNNDNNNNNMVTSNEGYTENRLYSQNNRNNDVEIINRDINIKNKNLKSYEKEEDDSNIYKKKKYNYGNPPKNIKTIKNGNIDIIIDDIDENDISGNKPQKEKIKDKKDKNKKKKKNEKNDKNSDKNSNKNSDKSSISQIYELNNEEKNELTYERALRYDKRNLCYYYCVILQLGHIIISVFCRPNDYNIFYVKLGLLLMTFPINLTFNIFFFTSKNIKSTYVSKLGDISKISELTGNLVNTIISSILSTTFLMLLKLLCLTHNSIRSLRKIKDVETAKKKSKNKITCIKIRINLYFILSFLFLIIFGYYIACFCAIFENIQIELIKSMFTSWLLSLLYPFLIYFVTSIFRRIALGCKCKTAYKINQLLQLI